MGLLCWELNFLTKEKSKQVVYKVKNISISIQFQE